MLCIYRSGEPVFPEGPEGYNEGSSTRTGEGEAAGMNVHNSINGAISFILVLFKLAILILLYLSIYNFSENLIYEIGPNELSNSFHGGELCL